MLQCFSQILFAYFLQLNTALLAFGGSLWVLEIGLLAEIRTATCEVGSGSREMRPWKRVLLPETRDHANGLVWKLGEVEFLLFYVFVFSHFG